MADTSTAGGKGALDVLKRKIGPLPAGVWLAIAAGLWWYFQRQKSAGTAAAGTSATGYGTDPAGNSGYIDPESGYVYGSAEDIASLQQQGTVASNTSAGTGTGTGSGTGGYTDDDAWATGAINYLVARGVDPATANQAITLYLAGQNLTSEQQADINLAITGIGAPPSLPGPSNTSPPPVQTPPGGTTTPPPGGTTAPPPPGGGTPPPKKAPAAPGGVTASGVTSTGFTLHWNAVTGATSYRVRVTYQGKLVKQQTASGTSASVTGLSPDHTYTAHVAAVSAAGTSAEADPAVKTLK